MTKRHFISLADHIRANRNLFCDGRIDCLADWLQSEFPQFKRDRWVDYIHGRCGSNGGEIRR